jgi:tetratricopeptide (TPR) repeat protein
MDKKAKLRILNKIGFLLIFIDFFMPIFSFSLNGFQIAKFYATDGILLSILLYIVFISSCIGVFLLILLLMKIEVSITYDWIVSIVTAIVTAFYFLIDMVISFFFVQLGTCIILSGMIISIVSLISYSKQKKYEENKVWEDAIKNSSEQIRLNPDVAEFYTMRGNLYYLKGQNDEAIRDYSKAIELEPNNGNVFFFSWTSL